MANDYTTLTPEEVAQTLGSSPWWVREQIRRGRIPHLRFGRGKIRLLPEHVDALVRMVTVDGRDLDSEPRSPRRTDLSALGGTVQSIRAHRRPPHVQGDAHRP